MTSAPINIRFMPNFFTYVTFEDVRINLSTVVFGEIIGFYPTNLEIVNACRRVKTRNGQFVFNAHRHFFPFCE